MNSRASKEQHLSVTLVICCRPVFLEPPLNSGHILLMTPSTVVCKMLQIHPMIGCQQHLLYDLVFEDIFEWLYKHFL